MAWTLKITDRNGHEIERALSVKTRKSAWQAYVDASPLEAPALASVELLDNGTRVSKAEWKCHGTDSAYRIRYS